MTPTTFTRKYATYKTISKCLNLTEYEIQHICRKALKTVKAPSAKQKERKLDQKHIDFLLSPKTLEQWAGLTMKERQVRFHRWFQNKRIAITSLRRLYLKNGVRRKKVRQEKYLPNTTRQNYVQICQNVVQQIDQAKKEGRRLIYLDEINFTKLAIKLREWSAKNSNLTVDQEDIYTGYRSVIASMSEERGYEFTQIHSKAIDADDFIDYLKKLRKKSGQQPLTIFMDQLAVHKSSTVKPVYGQLDMTTIYNVGYSPAFNPVESTFSKAKRLFNDQRLNNLVNKTGFNADKEIKAVFKKISQAHCAACVRKSLYLLKR